MYTPSIVQQKNIPHAIEFYTWLNTLTDDFADFDADASSETHLQDITGKQLPKLHYLGHHGSGSLICLWEKDTGDKIVWLDSEGYPFAVFADNFSQLLSLLPYGTGFIYDVLSKSVNVSNTTLAAVQEWYTDTPQEMIEKNKSRFPGLDAFLDFLKKESIEVEPNPVATIFSNYRNNADFNDWIKNN